MKGDKANLYYYNTDEYKEKLAEVNALREQVEQQKRAQAEEKKKKIQKETSKLKKIFTPERCGEENMHFVLSLIARAAFLRVELEYIEEDLRTDGTMDFFQQGLQSMWREHPLTKVHREFVKNYKDIITKLESYGKQGNKGSEELEGGIGSILLKGVSARDKYKK
jgi:hypothetical protein